MNLPDWLAALVCRFKGHRYRVIWGNPPSRVRFMVTRTYTRCGYWDWD